MVLLTLFSIIGNEKLGFFLPAKRGFLKKVPFSGRIFPYFARLSSRTLPFIGVEILSS